MWKFKMTDEMSKIENGDNVEIKAQVDFYIDRGETSLIVNWAKKLNNTGDLHAQFELMKEEFKNNGYFNKKLKLPEVFKKIIMITSLKGAAIHDFMYAIENSKSLIEIIQIDAQVQGSECPKQIIEYLNNNYINNINNNIDLIIITRGGGSMEDLWGFNNKELIETVYKRNIPILSAIGHMIDTTLLDFAADISAPTPSLAAQYIIDYNKTYIENLKEKQLYYHNKIISDVNKNLLYLDKLKQLKNEIKNDIKYKLDNYKNIILKKTNSHILLLQSLKNKYNNIQIYQYDNKCLDINIFREIVKENKPFKLVWNDIVIDINNYNHNE
jgi:exodeoxyribonuclease VII large subunit